MRAEAATEIMVDGAVLQRGAALSRKQEFLSALGDSVSRSPFRDMATLGGFTMSVAMTNCGAAGWVTDRTGYRYDCTYPQTGRPWPAMLDCFLSLAIETARRTGSRDFCGDV